MATCFLSISLFFFLFNFLGGFHAGNQSQDRRRKKSKCSVLLLSFHLFETKPHYTVQADLELLNLMPLSPKWGIMTVCCNAKLKLSLCYYSNMYVYYIYIYRRMYVYYTHTIPPFLSIHVGGINHTHQRICSYGWVHVQDHNICIRMQILFYANIIHLQNLLAP